MSYAGDPAGAGYGTAPTNDLGQPLYGATIGQAFGRFWQKYATFSGRASRSEYWWWFLIALVVNIVLKGVDIATSGGVMAASRSNGSIGDILFYLWSLAILVPGLAVNIRRLHDTDHSGFWILIALIPLVGTIILLVLLAGQDNPAGRRFD